MIMIMIMIIIININIINIIVIIIIYQLLVSLFYIDSENWQSPELTNSRHAKPDSLRNECTRYARTVVWCVMWLACEDN